MSDLCRSAVAESSEQRRVLSDVGATYRDYIVLELRKGPVILKIGSPVGVAIHQACNGVGRSLHMHTVSADLEVIVCAGSLIGGAPVPRHSPDVKAEPCAGIGLRSSDVFGSVHRPCQIPVLVPHCIAAHTGDVLG